MAPQTTLIDRAGISHRLKAQALGVGFDLAGIAELGEPTTRRAFDQWLDDGMNGSMRWMEGDGAELRRDTRRPHPGATHALVVAIEYGGTEPSGPIARYARGDDYHDVLRERLRELHKWLENEAGETINARPYVDSGPILERDLAQRAGLGWFGKNTLLINPRKGSFLFLASLFVEYPLVPDEPFIADRCGSCRRCIDACPTGALEGPRKLNASSCISYLTIELRDAIPEQYREAMGGLLYGCDICQEVCPWNISFTGAPGDVAFEPRTGFDSTDPRAIARELLQMDQEDYMERFRRSPMKRAKLRGLKRNSTVVLGNVGGHSDLPLLYEAANGEDELIAEHAEWAIREINSREDSGGLQAHPLQSELSGARQNSATGVHSF